MPVAPSTALLLIQDKGGDVIGEREIDALLIQPGHILKIVQSFQLMILLKIEAAVVVEGLLTGVTRDSWLTARAVAKEVGI
ncbi:hypothetical protein L1987_43596 [Smallanthus sonchifolius]|uniref:Uncharacterized protein n=1 Tax=Smallanthus sonchifolius TaxID=185202 RepID=A0ACB9GP37_9ASTR|nr:hypothetical protein L1987_43596 [Smallanthus sonchifolius]